ncbi:MAG: hypothetical protein OJF61_000686 [Rhodanobacteraceae bacterium]|jgi:hypothetical protein|nr:MAG: hypothetical protein OJF61_000686 [Rhodanobacteraceae bacterium]
MKAPEWSIADFSFSVMGGDAQKGAVALLAAYFDESGTTGADKIALYGGAVARTDEWRNIEKPWRQKLDEFQIGTYHASHCEHGIKEFAHLSRPIREALTGYLAGLIGGLNAQAFGSAILRKDWPYVPKHLRDACFDDPILFSLSFCFQHVSTWAKENAGSEPVAFVFACHEKYGPVIEQVHKAFQASGRWTNIGSLSFAKPQNLVQLQAADLLSYEFLQFALNGNLGAERNAWKSINSRASAGGKFGASYIFHDAESVQAIKPFASSGAA